MSVSSFLPVMGLEARGIITLRKPEFDILWRT